MNNTVVPSSTSSYGLGDFVQAMFRNKKKVVLLPLCIMSLAMLVIWFAPRKYRSEAKLFMQVGRESVKLDPTATTGDRIEMHTNNRDNEVVTAIDTLKSRGTIEKVVDQLGPDVVLGNGGVGESEPNAVVQALQTGLGLVVQVARSIDPVSDRERAVIAVERGLEVEAETDSTLITVQYDTEAPELAQLVTQTLIDVYRDEHLRLHRTSGSKEFFTKQNDALKEQLDKAVEDLREARNRLNIVSIEKRRQTLESRLASIELNLYGNVRELAYSRARVADIRQQLKLTPERIVAEETMVPNTGTDLLRDQVFELQVLMLNQQTKYRADHPKLKATREQLAKAETMLKAESLQRQETTNDVNPNYSAMSLSLAEEESRLAGLVAQNSRLNDQREQVIADQKQMNDAELEIDQLKRAQQLARTNYFRYADNLEKARINEELDNQRISNAIQAQQATFAEKPVSPNKLLIGLLAILLSGSSVVASVLVSEKLSNRIYKPEQLEDALGLPVFGTVPERRKPIKISA